MQTHLIMTNGFYISRSLNRHKLARCRGSDKFDQEYTSSFNVRSAIILAGYAFEVYNTASAGKVAKGIDDSKVVFKSSSFIRRAFRGVLMVSLQNAILKKDQMPKQAQRSR